MGRKDVLRRGGWPSGATHPTPKATHYPSASLNYIHAMHRRGLQFTATLAVGILTAAISPSSVLASDYIKSHCKVKESGFSSTPMGGQEIDAGDPGASARYNTSIGAVLRNPKKTPGVNMQGYIILFGANGKRLMRTEDFQTSTPLYVPAKGRSYLTANVETTEPVTRIRIVIRCKDLGKQPSARPGEMVRGNIVLREDGDMTITGTFKNRGRAEYFGQPTMIFRNSEKEIVGGYGCRSCPDTIGLLAKGDSNEWSVTMPDIAEAVRARGIVAEFASMLHSEFIR